MQWLKDGLTDWYNKIVAELGKWFQRIWDYFEWIGNLVAKFFRDFFIKLQQKVWHFGCYLYDLFFGADGWVWYIFDLVLYFGQWVLSLFPDLESVVLSEEKLYRDVLAMAGRLNSFFPMTESGLLLSLFLTFLLCFIIFKYAVKLIRGG